jgi:ribosomal-protein-alanine N-acetyltransferase
MAKFNIRLMTIDDITNVMLIEKSSYEFPWTKGIFLDCLSKNNYFCYIGECNNITIAYLIITIVAGEAQILNICVQNNQRNNGLGKLLLDHFVKIAKQNQAKDAFLEVRSSNKIAKNLYHNFGFNEIGIRSNYYPFHNNTREDAIVLALSI